MLRLLRNYLATIVVVVTLTVWRTPLSATFLTVGTILVLDTFLTNRDRLYFSSLYGADVDLPLREGRWLSVQAGALGAASACLIVPELGGLNSYPIWSCLALAILASAASYCGAVLLNSRTGSPEELISSLDRAPGYFAALLMKAARGATA